MMTTRPSRTRRLTAAVATGLVLGLLAAGCTGGGPSEEETTIASYTPVPDDQLFARIAELPHVESAKVSFRDNLTDGQLYSGSLVGDGAENPYATLDAAVAVLRQGRPGAQVLLTLDLPAVGGSAPVQYTSTKLLDRTLPDPLTARYGPQPGTGRPPSGAAVPTPSGWTPSP